MDQGLHIKPYTLKLIEEKVGKSLEIFLNRTPMDYTLRSSIDKGDLINLKKAKDTINRTKWQSTDWEKIFTNPTPIEGLFLTCTKNSTS